ncbi:hypothetical protein DPMN_144780 [Dreissena polymorpha]|uniref:Uncharacterized protein n=1 Tax=Dreissena polymorpha TaxID=45954 RepID=A0A9D4F8M5_DREPO|nr:hypothetical protein DPMN_144780 [Dreissena polymorpha]
MLFPIITELLQFRQPRDGPGQKDKGFRSTNLLQLPTITGPWEESTAWTRT